MRFTLIRKDSFIIQCYPNSHNLDEVMGYRGEGNNPLIKLISNQVRFSYVPKTIHPDLIALICVIIFYPFFTSSELTVFPEKISTRLALELSKLPIYAMQNTENGPKYKKTNACINVSSDNIDKALEPYRGKGASVLSFGGGLDSLATFSLFPNLTIIHEASEALRASLGAASQGTVSEHSQKDLGKCGVPKLIQKIHEIHHKKKQDYIIYTNSKELTDPPGWTTWISCIATSLLLANDLGTTNIVLGSSMGSLLNSCAKFRENGYEFPQNSIWANLLDKCAHIKLVTPILGLSELALIKIIDPRVLEYAIWCDKDKDIAGTPCKQCAKCFRRYLLLADYLDIVHESNWDKYNNLGVHKFLRDISTAGSKSTVGPTLLYLLNKHHKDLPHWITRYLLLTERAEISKETISNNLQKVDLFSWYHKIGRAHV